MTGTFLIVNIWRYKCLRCFILVYLVAFLNIKRPSLQGKWIMPKVRKSAVSHLMQCALPRGNIFFIIEGSAAVQTLIAMPSCNFLLYHSRNETEGEGDSGPTFTVCVNTVQVKWNFRFNFIKHSICWKPAIYKTHWESLQITRAVDCLLLFNLFFWSTSKVERTSCEHLYLEVGIVNGAQSEVCFSGPESMLRNSLKWVSLVYIYCVTSLCLAQNTSAK